MVSLFNSKIKSRPAPKIKDITIREFGGGWNVIDNDISLSTKYAKVLQNFYRGADNSQNLRYGTKFKDDIKDLVTGNIVDSRYFMGTNILVTSTGQIARTDNEGNRAAIFNSTIAALLPGAPAGWGSSFTQITFVPFGSNLIIHNGVDKPLNIDKDLVVTYLQDLGTGSNTNTPIGKYGCAVSDYHVIAGISGFPTTIYISSKATAGVFPGDVAPNDSISLNVGAKASQEADIIIGVAGYRSFLLIFFTSITLIMKLGTYDADGNHVPEYLDSMPQTGVLGQRVISEIENDILFGDSIGVSTGKRNLFVSTVENERISALIAPEYQKAMGTITDVQRKEKVFAVYNKLNKQYILHEPTNGRTFVFTLDAQLRVKAWSEFIDWTWTCGHVSQLGRTFFCRDTRIYQYGNLAFDEEYTADYLEDRTSNWANGVHYAVGDHIRDTVSDLSYITLVDHVSNIAGTFAANRTDDVNLWAVYEGNAINFVWEMPWVDAGQRQRTKKITHISADTKGTAHFNVNIYVDFLYKDGDDAVIYDPALTLPFVAGDIRGWGGSPEQPFGGGRKAGDARLWRFPVKFKTAKLIINGSTRSKLRIVSITILYSVGSFKR